MFFVRRDPDGHGLEVLVGVSTTAILAPITLEKVQNVLTQMTHQIEDTTLVWDESAKDLRIEFNKRDTEQLGFSVIEMIKVDAREADYLIEDKTDDGHVTIGLLFIAGPDEDYPETEEEDIRDEGFPNEDLMDTLTPSIQRLIHNWYMLPHVLHALYLI